MERAGSGWEAVLRLRASRYARGDRACTIERMYRPYSLDAKLAAVLPAGSLYAVGGRVRDEIRSELLGEALPIKDMDYVVAAELQIRDRKRGFARKFFMDASFEAFVPIAALG